MSTGVPVGSALTSHEKPLSPSNPVIDRTSITGLVLAGGRGSRMGGVDKGMVTLHGEPLAARALRQLAPQVGPLLISANRHLEDYARLGPVVSDALSGHGSAGHGSAGHRSSHASSHALDVAGDIDSAPPFDGPLAGILSGLRAAKTPWLACVPCDCPFFPGDLIARLSVPFADNSDCLLAVAHAPDPDDGSVLRAHPVFALMRTTLADALAEQLAAGERRLQSWCKRHTAVAVTFPNGHAFYNVNTLMARDAAQALSTNRSS